MNWIRIANHISEIPFGDNNLAEVNADGKIICMGKVGEEIFAFARKCPHASGLLANGSIDPSGNVVCPVHRYKFCMKNGRNVTGEGYYLKHWKVETREDGIYVQMEKSLFDIF
jgi:3-phenylpropionate/trans-cinnamate dioxygenase ferredoxin subunit